MKKTIGKILKEKGFKKEVAKNIFGKPDFTLYTKRIDGKKIIIADWYRGKPRFILKIYDGKKEKTKKLFDKFDLLNELENI